MYSRYTNTNATETGLTDECEWIYYDKSSNFSVKYVSIMPKWWRWFDVFRTWEELKLLPMLNGIPQVIRRIQERYSIIQRAKQKRRAYVQKIFKTFDA